MNKQPMSVTLERPLAAGDDIVVVRVTGEVGLDSLMANGRYTGMDGDTALDAALRSLVPHPPKLVVVDLTDATYLASLGIGTLVRFKDRITEAGGALRLVASEKLITLLKFGRLDKIFEVWTDIDGARKG